MKHISSNSIVALYRGSTVASARIVGATSDPEVVALVARALLQEPGLGGDPVLAEMEKGRKRAVRRARREALEELKAPAPFTPLDGEECAHGS